MTALAVVVMIIEACVAFLIWVMFSSKREAMRWRAEDAERERDLYKKWDAESKRARDAAEDERNTAKRAASDAIADYNKLLAEYDRLRQEYYKTREEVLLGEKAAWEDLAAILKGMQGSKKAAAKRS